MTFVDLYGEALDLELASADRTERFTTAKRKTATNAAQVEWVRRTGSFILEESEPVVSLTQEYDLQALIASNRFMRFATRQPYIKVVAGSVTTYIDGKNFPRLNIEDLDRDQPGWRQASADRPNGWYIREVGNTYLLGLFPPPKVPAGQTWTLIIPYVAYPNDMTADGDIPFENSPRLRAYHRGLAHFAASELERLRKNFSAVQMQLSLFDRWVREYQGDRADPAGTQVSFSHNYFSAAQRVSDLPPDPRRWP